jgi:hypothetical protein
VSAIARSVLYVLLLSSAWGCQRWQVDAHALASPQPERRRLEIWSRGQSTLVHHMRVVGDSIWAVPYWKAPDCDSCTVRIARAVIDSVRVQATDDARSAATVGASIVFFLVALWMSGLVRVRD